MKNVDIALHFHNNTFIIFINEIEKIIHCLMKPKRKLKEKQKNQVLMINNIIREESNQLKQQSLRLEKLIKQHSIVLYDKYI